MNSIFIDVLLSNDVFFNIMRSSKFNHREEKSWIGERVLKCSFKGLDVKVRFNRETTHKKKYNKKFNTSKIILIHLKLFHFPFSLRFFCVRLADYTFCPLTVLSLKIFSLCKAFFKIAFNFYKRKTFLK